MTTFKSVMLFLKIISLFIVQRNFGNIEKTVRKKIENFGKKAYHF